MAALERVGRVAGEIETAATGSSGAALRLPVQKNARLQDVTAQCFGNVVRQRVRGIDGFQWNICKRDVRRIRNPAEADVGEQIAGVGGRVGLGHVKAHCRQGQLGQHIGGNGLVLPTPVITNYQFVHQRRRENFLVAPGKNIAARQEGAVYQFPIRVRRGESHRAALFILLARPGDGNQVFGGRIVINLQCVQKLGPFERRLGDVIVLTARNGAVGKVRFGEEPQQGQSILIEPVCWDDIAGVRLARHGITNDDQIAADIHALGKIPQPFKLGRNRDVARPDGGFLRPVFLTPKEKHLVLFRIELARNVHRPAHRVRECVVTIPRFRQ